MLFEFKVAVRYLLSARLQSGLLMFGVAVGVVVFTFIAALMNGLGVRLTDNITGNVAHVTLEPALRVPRTFMASPHGRALFAIQPGNNFRSMIRSYRSVIEVATKMHGVRAVVPEVFGNATLARGAQNVAVTVTGVQADQADAIAPLGQSMVRGRLELGVGNLIIGSRLATELGVDVGDRVNLRAVTSIGARPGASAAEAVMVVRGIFTLGVQAIDERVVYVDLASAKKFFDVVEGVSLIELKVDDVWQAPLLAERLGRATRLKASNWLDRNARLQEGLRAQASTSNMIKAFSLLTIAIGVASALFLSVSRRRADIGILRSFGIGRGAIVRTFVLQGLLIGLVGALVGAGLGFGFAHLLLVISMKANGAPSIPIDPAQGEYLGAVLLAVAASAIAAVLPAWSASRIDPLEAIQS
ncbi:MAG: ABC transporter permease [Myxococcales bacterium]|nr:ABC transporter permease [Myxococcales bacterium]